MNVDIDVIGEVSLKDDHEIWNGLEKLRHKKNEIFEGCITDKTRSLIE